VNRVSVPMVVTRTDGTVIVTDSQTEGKYAKFFDLLGIPFLDQTQFESTVLMSNGHRYKVDYKIYHHNPTMEAYVEVKPFRPTDVEIAKAGELHRQTGIKVFIVWGTTFVSGVGLDRDKWNSDGTMKRNPEYLNGVTGALVSTADDGTMSYEEGYYFMANDRADGGMWEEVENEEEEVRETYSNARLESLLERGRRTITREKRVALSMRPIFRTHTRIITKTGRRFRPVDSLRPYLYRYKPFAQATVSGSPGPGDAHSDIMQHAYKTIRTDVAR